ncbi:hypothetical protein [Bacillus gaemokensis]|uniref:Uncharacterized protein n=1 Tax=Bacillus gaemokensis TaxID=574375 RepID=A0A073K9U1_9BACI|nr:hypothetical protein [Bacillus gaemokensis]KEK23227.1 hypothetical protein BAGA_09845 [Bacillus gaemokensis]KYG29025.1 hypothetical protein AZF08_15060 [Bacillus gaemokensis]
MFLYDLKNIYRMNKWKWFYLLPISIFLFTISVLSLEKNEDLTIWQKTFDYAVFPLPYKWLFIVILFLIFHVNYIHREIKHASTISMIRSHSKVQWFLGKLIHHAFLSISYFVVLFIIYTFFISLFTNETIFSMVNVILLIRFIIASVIIAVLQTVITVYLQPAFSLLCMMFYLGLAIFIPNPFLLGYFLFNTSPHHDLLFTNNEIMVLCIYVCALTIMIFIVIRYLQTKDLLANMKGEN